MNMFCFILVTLNEQMFCFILVAWDEQMFCFNLIPPAESAAVPCKPLQGATSMSHIVQERQLNFYIFLIISSLRRL